jgi:transketolase
VAQGPARAGRPARPARRGQLPEGLAAALPTFPADAKGVATRAASGKVLTALAPVMPELWGGSADLAESNNTTMAGRAVVHPEARRPASGQGGPYGRTLHFGIREFGMGRSSTASPSKG